MRSPAASRAWGLYPFECLGSALKLGHYSGPCEPGNATRVEVWNGPGALEFRFTAWPAGTINRAMILTSHEISGHRLYGRSRHRAIVMEMVSLVRCKPRKGRSCDQI